MNSSAKSSVECGLRKIIADLTNGKVVWLDDNSCPPWFEPGVICEVAEAIYEHSCRPTCGVFDDVVLECSEAGPHRLFWRRSGRFFGRELTEQEARHFAKAAGCSSPVVDPVTPKSGQVRLSCMYCDTARFDGVDSIPDDWSDVEEFQPFEESLQEIGPKDPTRSPTEWYTHLGVCPDCQKTNGY